MKAIILARVSTEEQINEGQSIPAQLSRAREYATQKQLIIKSEYQFNESSLKDKRTKFKKVIKEIRQSKEPITLIVETVDRLQRSFKESVLLDELRKLGKLEIHFIRENLIINKRSNSSEIQRWDLAVFVAKSFVLQIGDNVKRTYSLKLRNGEWINKSPIGYIKEENGSLIPDSIRANLIRKIFEMYSTGNYSLLKIRDEMKSLGLKSNRKNHKSLSKSSIHRIINNPFYYGVMEVKTGYSKGLYPHHYEPIIPKELFDRCQEISSGYHKKPFKYASKPFTLRGMIKCSKCDCTISPEEHKGHIYYSCTNYKKTHKKRIYVREETLLEPINKILKNIRLSDNKIKIITEDLKTSNKVKNDFHKQSLDYLRKEYDIIEKRISKMFDLRLDDDSITKDMFNKKLKEYKEKQAIINEKIQRYSDADENYYITANIVLNLAKRAYEIFKSSEPLEKRQLLNFLLQNCKLDDKKLSFELKTPFDTVLLANNCSSMGG